MPSPRIARPAGYNIREPWCDEVFSPFWFTLMWKSESGYASFPSSQGSLTRHEDMVES